MMISCKSFLYTFDLIGPAPTLFIFNNNKYKSYLTSFLSIIIILFSIIFIIFSLIQYFKYQNPIVIYSKISDDITDRTISIKDTFFMFQLVDTSNAQIINDSIAYYEGNYRIIYDNGNFSSAPLLIEKCEFGKNINLRYKELLKKKLNFGRPIETFYCISPKHENFSLFYQPNVGYNLISLNIILKNNSYYIPEKIQSLIVSENNIIDHHNKDKPISESFIYHTTSAFNSIETTDINYVIQYIKYESDDGFFYANKKKYFQGISFLDMTFYRKISDYYNLEKDLINSNKSTIGSITIEINKSYYDDYKRSYQRLQSLLAEIMNMINLVFAIGRQISFFLCDKKMSKDIISFLLNKEKNENLLTKNAKKINNIFKDHEKNKISTERNEIKQDLKLISNNIDNQDKHDRIDKFKLNTSKDCIGPKNDKYIHNNAYNILFKKINYYHILKSYFCVNDNNTKLIELYHNIVLEDLCIEKILKRLYNLENLYHLLSKREKEKLELFKNKRIKEIMKNIDIINDEKKIKDSFKKKNKK